VRRKEVVFDTDEGVRYDASMEGLAKLKPVFHVKGTVTAGNSSQMSDGGGGGRDDVGKSRRIGLETAGAFCFLRNAGCLPEEMGIGPVYAIPKALKMAGLTLDDIDVIELNEAFAAQGLAVMKAAGNESGKSQRQRRRGRARSSFGLHRRETDGDDFAGIETPRRALRNGHDVRRRRNGRGGNFIHTITPRSICATSSTITEDWNITETEAAETTRRIRPRTIQPVFRIRAAISASM
jgi:hypothetical protein